MDQDLEIRNLEDSSALPARCYTEDAFWHKERKQILSRHWQYVGAASQVHDVGQVLLTELLGKPVIVVRAAEDRLLAFYNVCRHRGGPLVSASGQFRRLQCGYHGWTYALDGRLIGAPHMKDAKGFDLEKCSLRQLHAETWQGMIFLAETRPALDVATTMAGISERIAPMQLDTLRYARRDEYKINCNWKIYVDNYLEGYHVPFVHPELNKALAFADYKTELFTNYSLQHSPLRPDDNPYARFGTHAYYYFVLPNIMFNIMPGRLQVNSVIPVDLEHCRVVFDYYYAEGLDDASRLTADREFSDVVQKEDIDICEILQRNMRAGVYESGRLSPHFENALHQFQNFVRQAYRQEPL